MGTAAFLDDVAWLDALRPDERERAIRHFRMESIPKGSELALPTGEAMGFVVEGEITLKRSELPGLAAVEIRLTAGDRWGELSVFAGLQSPVHVIARTDARVALLDAKGYAAITADYPIVWLEIATRLSRELKWKNDLLREIQEFDTTRGDPGALELFLHNKRRKIVRRRTGINRSATRLLVRRLVLEPGRDPAFWILAGFLAAIAASRAVVAMILRLNLQESLFNLKDSGETNPIHTHHFNYGFGVLIAAGLLAFVPRTRQVLLPLAFVFGFGLGLVFDEFALIWNLNPDYYAALNYQAQGVLAVVLLQLVYFRRFYATLFDRYTRKRG